MKENKFNRRKFLASMAIVSIGQMIPGGLLSFPVSDKKYSSNQNDLLWYIDSKGTRKKVKTGKDWEMKRMQILTGMQQAMGPLPSFSGLPNMDIKIIEEVKEQNYTRQNIAFTVAPNEIVSAYLYTPDKKLKQKKLPAILALHSTGSLGKKIVDGQSSVPNRAYAKELASRGYVVIAPDYPGFGDMANYNFENDRYASGTMKGIFDNMRCVDLLQSIPDVNPDRIGVIGHSLGGHNALFTAAFDKRLKVVVASCGWTLFDFYNPGENRSVKAKYVLAPWAQDLYMPLLREKYFLDNKKFPFNFDEVIATIAPRPFFTNSPLHDDNFNVEGVKKGMKEVSAVYNFLGAKKSLEGHYPNSGHDFSLNIRSEVYQFIEKSLAIS